MRANRKLEEELMKFMRIVGLLAVIAVDLVLAACPAASPGPTNTPPSAPTGVTATAGNAQVTISWSSVSGATYNLYWSTTTGVTIANGSKITE